VADLPTEAASFPVTLRCGHGIWFSPPLLARASVVGELADSACSAALDIVERLIDGRVDHDPGIDDDEVQQWYERLDAAVHEVAQLRERAEDEEAAIARPGSVVLRTPFVAPELAWAASGTTTEWPSIEFGGPGDRVFALEGGMTDRSRSQTTFRCALIAGARFPLAEFRLTLVLNDGSVLQPRERVQRDGDAVTFEALSGPEDVREVVVVPMPADG
jgi:hypothetical protein